MTERTDPRPAALYARVSSDRQDVDLSISAQLRALRDYAEKNNYLVAREYIDEAESGRDADRPQFRQMLDAASADDAPFEEILVWKFSRFTRTPSPSSPCCAAAASASSPSPGTPTTRLPASSWRRSSRASTSSTRKILRRKSPGACARPPRAVSGSPAARPTATRRSTSRTGRRSARGHHRLRPGDERVSRHERAHRVEGLHPLLREGDRRRPPARPRSATRSSCPRTVPYAAATPRR